jgi:hypothetical protein
VLVEVARAEEVGSSEVGSSGKVGLSEMVVLVLLAFRAVAFKEGSGFLKGVKGSRLCHHGMCHQGGCRCLDSGTSRQGGSGFLKSASTSRRVKILFIAVVAGRTVTGAHGFDPESHGQVKLGFALRLARSDLSSLDAHQAS